ncbi:hypothetical protein NBRC10513v2_004522 [Rhodotorula toruloides]
MSTAPPSTLRAPGRRAKSSATSSNGEELAGEEVLELRLFAEKKVWIEDKIQFLSSLPPIEVTTPEPPARSPVSHDELEAWWTAHDRIEREIQAYDMGDLTKMRNIARVPLSASFLDKLIDSSAIPLPESFLDEQDRLEDSVKAISEGLQQFTEELVAQRSAADHLFRRLEAVSASARTLESDVQTARAELPSFTTTADFAPRLVDLERVLDDIRADFHDLPRPLHPSVPDQSAHNSELVATLQQYLRDANEATRSAETAAARYAADRGAVESAQAVRTKLDRLGDELATFQRDVRAIAGRPARLEDGLAFLDASETGAAFEQEWDRLAMQVAAAIEQSETVQKDAARCVVELADRKICAALRKEVKDATENLRGLRLSAIKQLDAETRRRDDMSTLRAACRTIEGAERWVREVEGKLLEVGETTKWREGRMAPIETEDAESIVTKVRSEVDNLFSTSVSPVLALLDKPTYDALRRHLHERSTSVSGRINALDTLASQVDGLCRQSRSVQAFVQRVEAATTELRGVLHELDAALGSPADALPGDDDIGAVLALLERCTTDVEALVEGVATSVSFLAPASPPSSTNGSADLLHLAEQDDHVRTFVNNSCARLRGLVDEAQQSADLFRVMQKARKWDADCLEAERTVDALEQEAEDAPEVSETSPSTSVPRPDLDFRRVTLVTLDLAPLSVALGDLADTSCRSSGNTDLHTSRLARLDRLRDRSERLAHSVREMRRLSSESRQVSARTDAAEDDALRPAKEPEPVQQDLTAASSTTVLAFPDDDVVPNPFTLDPPPDEPAAFSELRRRVERIETAGWLSPTTLVLPSAAEAAVMDGELATCRNELAALAEGSDETLVWAGLPSVEREIEDKGKEVSRVAALAHFADFLAKADSTLSDLLNAVDAATPDATPVTPDAAASPVLPLSDALVAASEAVTAVRVEAIPLADDGRVELGVVIHLYDVGKQRRATSCAAQHAIAAILSGHFYPVHSFVRLPLNVPHLDGVIPGQLLSLERYSP